MNKITSLHQANEYLKDVAIYLWQKENIIHCTTSVGHVIRLRYPEVEPCKSMSEAVTLLQQYAQRTRDCDSAFKRMTEEQQDAVKHVWQLERESYKAFNEIVQGYCPPHK